VASEENRSRAQDLRRRAAAATVAQDNESLDPLRGQAALFLLDELELCYEGLREYIDACVAYAERIAAERLAAEVGATRAVRNAAPQARGTTESSWSRAKSPNAEDPAKVVKLYSRLASIAADYLDPPTTD
jgi:hypothetical protein